MAHPDAAITLVQFDETGITSLQALPGSTSQPPIQLATEDRPPALPDLADGELSPCIIILPRHEVTLRLLTLPSQDPDELARMVQFDAADSVPYPIDEMEIRHHVLSPLPSGESRVMVVLVQRSVVEARLEALKRAGGEALDVLLSTACLAAACAANASSDEIGLLHVDRSSLELIVIRDGVVQFSRAVTQATPWDLQDAHSRESLAYESRELLGAYRRESADGLGIEAVHVSATGHAVESIAALLEDALGKSCTPADFLPKLRGGAERCPATFAGAHQIYQGLGPIPLSLAPPKLARERTMRRAQAGIREGATLVAVVLAALLLCFGQAWWQRHQLIQELTIERDAIAPRAEGIAAKQQGLRIISRQVEQGASFLQILAGIAEASPPTELNITRIQYDKQSGVDIWGRATAKDRVLKDFLGGIRRGASADLALFSQAHSLYETVGTERNQSIVNYQITIPIHEEDVDDATTPTR